MEIALIELLPKIFVGCYVTIVLFIRGTCVSAKTKKSDWTGREFQMNCLNAGFWMIIGGGIGYFAGWEHGAVMALIGVAIFIPFDGRKQHPLEGKS